MGGYQPMEHHQKRLANWQAFFVLTANSNRL